MTDTNSFDREKAAAPQRSAEAQPVPGDVAADELPEEAAELAKDAVRESTGVDDAITKRDEEMTAEDYLGGPTVESDAQTELGDEDVPDSWTREPLPRPMRGE